MTGGELVGVTVPRALSEHSEAPACTYTALEHLLKSCPRASLGTKPAAAAKSCLQGRSELIHYSEEIIAWGREWFKERLQSLKRKKRCDDSRALTQLSFHVNEKDFNDSAAALQSHKGRPTAAAVGASLCLPPWVCQDRPPGLAETG